MPPSPQCATDAQIEKLANLTLKSLRQRWAEIFGKPAPAAARSEYLIRAIAFHVQSEVYGALSPSLSKRLKKLLSGSPVESKGTSTRAGKLRFGTRLLRDWRGETHEIQVVENGYRYRGMSYQSLSEIARLITGTRWSGPLFFGLKGKAGKVAKGESQASRPTYFVDLGSKAPSGRTHVKPSPNNREVGRGL